MRDDSSADLNNANRSSNGNNSSSNISLAMLSDEQEASDTFNALQAQYLLSPLMNENQYYRDALTQAVFEDPKLLAEALQSPELSSLLRLHKRTLFITIYCSILQGAFLAYTPSNNDDSIIVIAMYYSRLFLDLSGRPLALLPRPQFFNTIEWLFFWSSLRIILMLFFFVYIAAPDGYFFRNDWFIIIFQVNSIPYLLLYS